MNQIRTSFATFALSCLGLLTVPQLAFGQATTAGAAVKEPVIARGFIGSPRFETKEGPLGAGTAFLMKTDRQFEVVLLTALHLFGPHGGLKTQKTQAELPSLVTKVALQDITGINELKMPLVAVPIKIDPSPDLVVFRPTISNLVTNPGRFADALPAVGETLWLAAHVRQPRGVTLHACTVTEIKGERIHCRFVNQAIETNGGSGGPYLNAKGEVVGIHDGSVKTEGNKQGIILSAAAIRAVLKSL
ncbi:MAG TPA: trypsin-like peptidase domain-containing protein [Chthoniobacterales bacterium]|jgi:hypothetical protein